MVDRNDLAEMFAGQRFQPFRVPPPPDPYKVSPSQAITEGGNILGPHVGDVFSSVLSYIPWLGKYVAAGDELAKTPEERLADVGAQPLSPTDVNVPSVATAVTHGGPAAPPPATRTDLAKVKKLTKKEQLEFDRKVALNENISRRGLSAGENKIAITNPSEEELAAIRAEKGGGLGGEKGNEEVLNTEGVAQLFDKPSERTREQRPLDRRVRPEMTDRVAAMINNPAARKAIQDAAEKGRAAQGWYDTTPLRNKFLEILGPEEGQKAFEDYIGYVAGSSSDNKLGSNIRTGSFYYANERGGGRNPGDAPYVRKLDVVEQGKGPTAGQPKEGVVVPGYETPSTPYGHVKQQTHMHNVNQFGANRRFDSERNPKIEAFRENLLGNWTPTTVDKHAMRLAAMATRDPRWLSDAGQQKFQQLTLQGGMSESQAIDQLLQDTPTTTAGVNWAEIPDSAKGEYAAIEQMWNDVAKEMNVTPAELQAMAWIGGGEQTGLGSSGTFMDSFMDRVRRSSIQYNIPPEQVIELMVRGKLTLAELAPNETPATQGTSMVG